MKKINNSLKGTAGPACGMCARPDSTDPMTSHEGQTVKVAPSWKRGWWARYVSRLKKHEGDVRSCCH